MNLLKILDKIDFLIYNEYLDQYVAPALLILILLNSLLEYRATIYLYQKVNYKISLLRDELLLNFFLLDKIILLLIGVLGYIYYFYYNYFIFLFLIAFFLVFLLLLKLRYYKTKPLSSVFKTSYSFFVSIKLVVIYLILLSSTLYFDSYLSIIFISYLNLLNYRLLFYTFTPIDKLYFIIKKRLLIKKINKTKLDNTFIVSSPLGASLTKHLWLFLKEYYLINSSNNPLNEIDFLEEIIKGKNYKFSFIQNIYPEITNKLVSIKNKIVYDNKISKIIYNMVSIDLENSFYHYEISSKTISRNNTKIYYRNNLIFNYISDIYYKPNQMVIIISLILIHHLKLNHKLLLNTNLMELFNINIESDIIFISNNRMINKLELCDIYASLQKLGYPITTMLKNNNRKYLLDYLDVISNNCETLLYYSDKKKDLYPNLFPKNNKLKTIIVLNDIEKYENYYNRLEYIKPYVVLKLED